MREIPLSRGLVAFIDDQDFNRLRKFKWSVKPCNHGTMYAVTNIKGPDRRWHQEAMHRMLLNPAPDEDVIFRNHNGLDCRHSNMLVVDKPEARRHHRVRSDSKTGLKGISHDPVTNSWSARIVVHGQPLILGTFHSVEDAQHAYDQAVKSYYGRFAPVHKPDCDHPSARKQFPRPVPPPQRNRRPKPIPDEIWPDLQTRARTHPDLQGA
jgi:hypothetical protein